MASKNFFKLEVKLFYATYKLTEKAYVFKVFPSVLSDFSTNPTKQKSVVMLPKINCLNHLIGIWFYGDILEILDVF